jgi:hypothetical protein
MSEIKRIRQITRVPGRRVAFDERPAGPTPDGGESYRSFLEARYDFVLQVED